VKLSLFANDKILYLKDPKYPLKKKQLLDLGKEAGYKIND
jgi:hypothetical protein